MASSTTAFWAAYNGAYSACCAAKGSRGPYHRHCGCALHFLPHDIHSPTRNDCLSVPRNGTFKSLSVHGMAQKKSNGGCCSGSPLVQASFESCSESGLQGEEVLSIAMILELELQEGVQTSSGARRLECCGVESSWTE